MALPFAENRLTDARTLVETHRNQREAMDLQCYPLRLNDTLTLLLIYLGLSLLEHVQRVQLRHDAACYAKSPGPERIGLEFFGVQTLPNPRRVESGAYVEGQVDKVAELAGDGGITQDGVEDFGVSSGSGSLEVLDVLADAHQLASEAELLLNGFPRRNGIFNSIGTEKVPGVKARKVLDRAEELVAADRRRGELEVVRHGRVVDDKVGDHL